MAKRKVWSADLEVYATIYVIAETEEEARKKIETQLGNGIEVGDSNDVSGLSYDNEDLPEISFSPAMTVTSKQGFAIKLVDEGPVAKTDSDARPALGT